MSVNEQGLFEKPCETDNLVGFFSTTKKRILLILKKNKEMDLKTLSESLQISKMGVLKHVKDLEELGLIKRLNKNIGVGRPRLVLTLTNEAETLFPTAYRNITMIAFEVVEEELGKPGIRKILNKLYERTYDRYKNLLTKEQFDERVKEFSVLRDQDGYMVELVPLTPKKYELRQYNCPLHLISEKYTEACKFETQMFRKLFNAEVQKVNHETTDEEHVCKFIIKSKNT